MFSFYAITKEIFIFDLRLDEIIKRFLSSNKYSFAKHSCQYKNYNKAIMVSHKMHFISA